MNRMIASIRQVTAKLRKHILIRYLISGGTGAVVTLSLLYALTDLLHIWYLASGVIAFIISVIVSFTLQKFWTFRDMSAGRNHVQFGVFVVIACFNLGLNTLLLYLFTNELGFHYLVSQIVSSILIAVWSFFAYRMFVFKKILLA